MATITDNFITTVADYCRWAEGNQHSLLKARRFLLELMLPIPELAASGFEFDNEVEEVEEDASVNLDNWQAVHRRFSDLPFQYYFLAFDPHDLSADELVSGDLLDDLADIYRDLLEGLELHEAGHTGSAITTLLQSYNSHWGAHAANALRALDAFYRKTELALDDAKPADHLRIEWHGIRTVYHFGTKADGTNLFEERICVFSGTTFDEAFAKAQQESEDYGDFNKMESHPLQEAYLQDGDTLIDGYEVFSQVFEFDGDLETFHKERYERFEYIPDP